MYNTKFINLRISLSGLFMLCSCFIFSMNAAAEEAQSASKTGLVLSGGGARGLAHVGVLYALEEYGINVDAVVGTSMGAIVGALYATGHNADGAEDVARTTDWGYAFTDKPPRTDTPYVYRRLDAGLAANYRVTVNRGRVVLPRGVLQGQNLSQILDSLFASYDEIDSFDELKIPYRAVAADLVTGDEVILGTGRLSTAVRASMSIPGLIEPVEMDDKLLVDGGIANNMPVSVIQDMGVDNLIVVDVGSPLRNNEEIENIIDVLDHLSGLMVTGNTEYQKSLLGDNDLLIEPDLDGFSNTSFTEVDNAIEQGYDAAVKALQKHPHWQQFTPQQEEPAKEKQHEKNEEAPRPIIEFVEVKNNGRIKTRLLRNRLRQKKGEPLDVEQLQEDISMMYGLEYFKQIRYQVIEKDGQKGLLLEVDERSGNNHFFRAGLMVSEDFQGNGEFGLGASVRMTGLNNRGGTAFMRGDLGTRPRIEARFVQPFDEQMNYFIEPIALYQAEPVDIYDSEKSAKTVARYRRKERQTGLFLGRNFARQRAEARVGVMRTWGEISLRGGDDLVDAPSTYDDGYYSASLGWDSLDDLAFPKEGTRWNAEWQSHHKDLYADKNFQRFEFDATYAKTWNRFTLVLEGDTAMNDRDDVNFATAVPIGGFLSLSGTIMNSRWGQHRALLRSIGFTRLGKKSIMPVSVPMYVGASLEQGNVWQNKSDIGWRDSTTAGSLFVAAKTPLGPAYLSYGMASGGEQAVNLYLGQLFR